MSVLKRPILTEKATGMAVANKFVFEVEKTANKIEIAKAIERMYGVTVMSVDTMRCIGTKKSRASRGKYVVGKTSTIKKAIITVKEGDAIDIYGEVA